MKITMKRFLLTAGLFLGLAFTLNAVEMASPNGAIKVNFELNNGVPTYSVTFRGKMMIKPSRLGYELSGAENLLDGFTLLGQETR